MIYFDFDFSIFFMCRFIIGMCRLYGIFSVESYAYCPSLAIIPVIFDTYTAM